MTGFRCIDHLTGGLHIGSVITIGARSGMGKSSFSLSLASNLTIKGNIPCLYLSAAHSSVFIAGRLKTMLCNEVGESQLYINDTIDMDFAVVEQSVLEANVFSV